MIHPKREADVTERNQKVEGESRWNKLTIDSRAGPSVHRC